MPTFSVRRGSFDERGQEEWEKSKSKGDEASGDVVYAGFPVSATSLATSVPVPHDIHKASEHLF